MQDKKVLEPGQREAFFRFNVTARKNGDTTEEYLCAFNQRAMRTIVEVTGKEPFEFLAVRPGEKVFGLDRVQVLSYACTETFRRGNGYRITFDEWIDGPYLGDYGSAYWLALSDLLQELVSATFPWVAGLELLWQAEATVAAARSQPQSNSPSPLIGPGDTTSPSAGASSTPSESFGTSGTIPD